MLFDSHEIVSKADKINVFQSTTSPRPLAERPPGLHGAAGPAPVVGAHARAADHRQARDPHRPRDQSPRRRPQVPTAQ